MCYLNYDHHIHHDLHYLLKVYLNDVDVRVRESTAFALLNYFPVECEKVLSEIANGEYGIISFNAEITLSEWRKGHLIFPFIDYGDSH